MAVTNSKFLITGLDFDTIKESIKNFLRSQQEFTDYDFEGSGLSVLLDTLAYNTHYLGYYLNMVANEQFLDSADLRASVVSIAKQLNYTPTSRRCATAVVNLRLIPTSPLPEPKITIPKFFKFSTVIDGKTYNFITNEAYSVDLDITDNTYKIDNVVIKEGLGYTYRFIANGNVPYERFIIPNAGIDTSTMYVRVQASAVNTNIEVFTLADDVNELNGSSLVYFLQEGEDRKYEIYFGDRFLGKKLSDQNIVIVDYILCNGGSPNKASNFSAAQSISGIQTIQTTTVSAAYGGSERESIDAVRFSAPKNYEAQNRAVTVSDYRTLLLRYFPNIESLSVWGGEDSDPPVYGKVFISLKPVEGYVITQTAKDNIKREILSAKNVVTVIPEIVDPDYIYVEIDSIVKYDAHRTSLSENEIKTMVLNTINKFKVEDINQFEKIFKHSLLSREIDFTDTSITNNLTTLKLQKRFTPILNTYQNVTLNFNTFNPIEPGTVSSTKFVVSNDPTYISRYVSGDIFAFDDDREGNLRVYKQVGVNKVIVKAKAGTVDYDKGIINITNFLPSSIIDGTSIIKVSAKPQQNDVIPARNFIVTVDLQDVKVTMEANKRTLV